jgi:PAT family beta-lactamase induction signal transducer AmpG
VNLADNRWLRLATLCLLYIAQGLPWGFTATTIPSYLGQRGLEAAAIGGALAMTTLPYSFKWIWGPLIDAFPIPRIGRRRPWIVFAQLMMAATILAMIAIPDLTGDIQALAWMIFLHTIFNSMQDVAVDALAVDLLQDDERGRVNGMMYAC